MCGRGVWNEGASIKHHAIICCGIVCFDSSLPLFPFGLELSKLSKSQVKKCLTFSSSVGYSWISCRLYRRFETCNCSTMMLLWSISLIWNDCTYMHLPRICKPILSLNVCVFDPKPREKWIQFHLHITWSLKNGLQNTQGSGTAPVWMPGWCDGCDVIRVNQKLWVRLWTLGCLPQ